MAKQSRKSKAETANMNRRGEALDRVLSQREWDALIANLAHMAKSSDNAVAIRATELLLRYKSEQAAQPPEEEDVQIKYIMVHEAAPNPNAKQRE